MNKIYPSAKAALDGIVKDGQLLAVGGFGLCGIPEALIDALRDSGVKNLTVISNNAGVDGFGLGKLLETRQIKKMISSYVGENKEFERQYLAGELELEFTPQGTLAEKLRAGGAGIPAFFTATGVGTIVAEGKELREFDGRDLRDGALAGARRVAGQGLTGRHVGQPALPPDGAQLQPGRGHGRQDLHRRGRGASWRSASSRPTTSTCRASTCTASCSTRRPRSASRSAPRGDESRRSNMPWTQDQMAAARGPGTAGRLLRQPGHRHADAGGQLSSPDDIEVWLQSENGMLGIGPFPDEDEVDADLINAGKQTVTTIQGSRIFGSHDSFAMIRGGKINLSHPGRDAGQREGRPGQLDDPRQDGQGHGRRDGPGGRRQARDRADGARGQEEGRQRST